MAAKESSPLKFSGWRFKLALTGSEHPAVGPLKGAETSGMVMYEASHDGHYLADRVSVEGIWINAGQANEVHLHLRPDDFDLFSDVAIRPSPEQNGVIPENGFRPPYQFSVYPTVFYAQAVFQSKEPIFPGGSRLRITQTYLLTPYSGMPAHEPGGVLAAARLFPLVEFQFISDSGDTAPDELITTIRFDYRIQYNLDVFLDSKELVKLTNADRQKLLKRPQKAALIRDKDPFTFPPAPFLAIEKPLWYEVIGDGLKNGFPGDPVPGANTEEMLPTTWDNLHWWGDYEQLHQISAPGAFHAAHLHWRWGKVAQEPAPVLNVFPGTELGEKQFIGTYIGGPLLDPRIPRQDISVIVVERGTINELDRDFFAQLTAIRPMPDFIKDGAPLELWMPIQVRLGTANATRKGMVFIHGLYFAHDPEKYRLTPLSRIGTKEDEYHNGNSVFPDQEWQRPPQPE